uniref:CCHC-type domain-containing protein n=1 Tax=Acrobeloides nanus TaxID=290746 RepID=A0A914ESN8_9BILA
MDNTTEKNLNDLLDYDEEPDEVLGSNGLNDSLLDEEPEDKLKNQQAERATAPIDTSQSVEITSERATLAERLSKFKDDKGEFGYGDKEKRAVAEQTIMAEYRSPEPFANGPEAVMLKTVEIMQSLAERMNAPLPALDKYDGSNKGGTTFREFLKLYELRYGALSDSQKVDTLGLFLDGVAKNAFNCVDKSIGFDEVVRSIEDKLVDKSKVASMNKIADLGALKKLPNWSWTEFLTLVETRVRKAFEGSRKSGKDLEIENMDDHKVRILFANVYDTALASSLHIAYEKCYEGDAFATLRDITLTHERMKRNLRVSNTSIQNSVPTYRSTQQSNRYTQNFGYKYGLRNLASRQNSVQRQNLNVNNSNHSPLRTNDFGDPAVLQSSHNRFQISNTSRPLSRPVSQQHQSTNNRNGVTCYKCNQHGHVANFCPQNTQRNNRNTTAAITRAQVPDAPEDDFLGTFASCSISGGVLSTLSSEVSCEDVTGRAAIVETVILGHPAKTLLDTGSITLDVKLKDASDNEMEFMGHVELSIQIKGVETIVFCLVKRMSDLDLLIGKNAFDKHEIWRMALKELIDRDGNCMSKSMRVCAVRRVSSCYESAESSQQRVNITAEGSGL